MENKLTLEHLAPYLPYGLGIWFNTSKGVKIHTMSANNINDVLHYTTNYKPILRPLSDLTKEIEHNGEKFVPVNELAINPDWIKFEDWKNDAMLVSYEEAKSLLKWHFDLFALIDKNIAVDINTLKGGQDE